MGMVDRLRRKQALKEAQDEADKVCAKAWADFCLYADITMLYALRVAFGFGKVRLERFYWAMIENHMHQIGRYKSAKGDDYHYTAMKRELKNAGVDVEALQAEAERLYPNGTREGENDA